MDTIGILKRREQELLEDRAQGRRYLLGYLAEIPKLAQDAVATMEEADPNNDHTYEPMWLLRKMRSVQERLSSLELTRLQLTEVRRLIDHCEHFAEKMER